jgi:hypothetical protein
MKTEDEKQENYYNIYLKSEQIGWLLYCILDYAPGTKLFAYKDSHNCPALKFTASEELREIIFREFSRDIQSAGPFPFWEAEIRLNEENSPWN